MSIAEQLVTEGEFATEPLAWEPFDRIVAACGAFRSWSEVSGDYLQPRFGTEVKRARIDRILVPLQKAVDGGWLYGAIGIEGKKSGHKLGPVLAQAMDYSRCVFELPKPPGLIVALQWVFIYPSSIPGGELMSVAAQHRIGNVRLHRDCLTFSCGGTNGLEISEYEVRAKALPMGRKRGSR